MLRDRRGRRRKAVDSTTLIAAAVASALAAPATAQEGDFDPFTPDLPVLEEVVAVGRLRSSATDVVQERLDQQAPRIFWAARRSRAPEMARFRSRSGGCPASRS